MGVIGDLIGVIFGNGRNVLRETAGIFVENAESGADRARASQAQAMTQFAQEFGASEPGYFDRLMDALNRVPRPALALGTLALFVAAMSDPVWFAARMRGLALVPEPLWWLLGVVVSFYFGARHQRKALDFQRDIASALARAPHSSEGVRPVAEVQSGAVQSADTNTDAQLTLRSVQPDANPALEDWKAGRQG